MALSTRPWPSSSMVSSSRIRMRSCAQTRTFRSRATSTGDLRSTRPSVESGARVGDDLHLMSELFRRDG